MPIVEQKPDFASKSDLLKRLIYSKYLFNRARLIYKGGNELASAEAILTAHNSIEMLIRVVAEFVDAKHSETFMEQLRNIGKKTGDEPPYLAAMDRLNSVRVAFKHKGVLPHPNTVVDIMPGVSAFCLEATKRYLALDYDTVSLADLIQNADAKAKVKEAEAAMAADKTQDAFRDIRMAFDVLHKEARERYESILIKEIRYRALVIPERDALFLEFAKRLPLDDLMSTVSRLVDITNGMLLGVEPARLARFLQTTPTPSYRGFGREHVEYLWMSKQPKLSPDDFSFCHQFVIDYALWLASEH